MDAKCPCKGCIAVGCGSNHDKCARYQYYRLTREKLSQKKREENAVYAQTPDAKRRHIDSLKHRTHKVSMK